MSVWDEEYRSYSLRGKATDGAIANFQLLLWLGKTSWVRQQCYV